MARDRQLGYGGIANTFGVRDFSGKAEAEEVSTFTSRWFMRVILLLFRLG